MQWAHFPHIHCDQKRDNSNKLQKLDGWWWCSCSRGCSRSSSITCTEYTYIIVFMSINQNFLTIYMCDVYILIYTYKCTIYTTILLWRYIIYVRTLINSLIIKSAIAFARSYLRTFFVVTLMYTIRIW